MKLFYVVILLLWQTAEPVEYRHYVPVFAENEDVCMDAAVKEFDRWAITRDSTQGDYHLATYCEPAE